MPSNARKPHGRRTLLTAAAAGVALTALTLAAAPPSNAATTSPLYSGTGWKAWTANGIYSISPGPYVVEFADATARSKLAHYFTTPAAQVTASVGVPITVSTTLNTTPVSACPPRHVILIRYVYRPIGTKGISQTYACHNTADGSAWGAHILMDTEYWTSTAWFSTNAALNESYRRNAVTHELGHALGLDHPNTDLNHDGRVSAYECVKNSSGWTPVMCSPSGGDRSSTGSGKYTAYDLTGLRQLARNWYLRQG